MYTKIMQQDWACYIKENKSQNEDACTLTSIPKTFDQYGHGVPRMHAWKTHQKKHNAPIIM